MPRIFLPISDHPDTIRITGEKARYLKAVLRCTGGEELEVLDGRGRSFRTKIRSITKKELLAEVLEEGRCETESSLNIILVQGLLKGEKMDFVIQKTTELGVKEIIPAITERSQVRDTRRSGRWKKVAEEASRQSGRSEVPLIHDPVPFSEIFSGIPSYEPYFIKCRGLIFREGGGIGAAEAMEKAKDCESVMLAVGPEGGFTGDEVKTAESRGFITTSLGNRILRAETAAIAVTCIAQLLLGDLG